MPQLRRQRRDKRARAPKRRKRRNLVKFIPEADSDFAHTAIGFVHRLKRHMEEYHVTAADVAAIEKAVTEFRSALTKTLLRRFRTEHGVDAKNRARTKAEEIVRRYANIIRANPNVSDLNKKLLRLSVRKKKLGKSTVPERPPALQFLGSGDGVVGGVSVGSSSGIHVLKYYDDNNAAVLMPSSKHGTTYKCRPDGAARIELFWDMIPAGEPVPRHPAERGWPKYLRSYTHLI